MEPGKREVVLCTLGTHGDIAPFIAMARTLLERGHRVTILSNENWRALAMDCGASFSAIGPQDPTQSSRDDFAFFRHCVLPSFHASFQAIASMVSTGTEVLVVHKAGMLGAQCAAEKLGLRSVKVALQPSAVRSVYRPSWPLTPLARGRLGALARRSLIPAIYWLSECASRYRRLTNQFRVAQGLRALRPGETNRLEDALVLTCPRWFAMPQPDWPGNCHFAGFPFVDGTRPDTGIAEFIAAHGAPLVFTPGTGVSDTGRFFRLAREVCDALDAPGVFLSPHSHEHGLAPRILCRSYVDLGALLPQARLLVHHGGIGTTAQALRAGIPQLVMPRRFDQPDNAMRIASLRLGAVALARQPTAAELIGLARRCLSDQTLQARVQAASRDIRACNAAQNIAGLIEGLLDEGIVSAGLPGAA